MKRIDANLVTCRAGLIEATDHVPTRLLLVADGNVVSVNGDFVLDAEGAAEAIRQFNAHSADLVFDYEHQTLGGQYASPDGKAKAAGWITNMEYEPGRGLFVTVRWTAEAENLIACEEYRYFSPVALVRKDDKRMIGLHSVALTNKPAIVRSKPIVATVNADGIVGEIDMNDDGSTATPTAPTLEDLVAELKTVLGMEEGDAIAVVQAALAKLKEAEASPAEEGAEAVPASMAKALALKDGAKMADAVAAISKLTTTSGGDADVVALKHQVSQADEQIKVLSEKVATERKARQAMEAERVVNADQHKGKMAASEVAIHINKLKKAENFDAAVKEFGALMDTRPVVLNQSHLPSVVGDAGGEGREAIILSSAKDFDRGKASGDIALSTKEQWVNGALRRKAHKSLATDEVTKYC
ncbi:MAG TPA: hypothetical protein ENI79_02125 [Rhodospirillales bacterium]|nr:hypothetical protein [Rhodospirillales bacterium]